MKLNKKGFTLAEVIVVSVVIVTVLVTLFTALNRLVSAFETRNRYYDIDAAYLAVEVNNLLIKNKKINSLVATGKTTSLTVVNLNDANITYIKNYYKEDENNSTVNTIFSLYNKDKIKEIERLISNQTSKDYIEYLNDNLNYEDNYTYVIISELCQTKDDCRYYTLKVR